MREGGLTVGPGRSPLSGGRLRFATSGLVLLLAAAACTVKAPGKEEAPAGLANGAFEAELDGFRMDRGMAAVRADFQALRAHLKLDRVNAIGWSNGAMNLVLLAAERPETPTAAVFVHGLASFSAEDGRELQAKHPDLVKRYGRLLADVSKPGLTAAEQTARQRKMWLEEYFPTLVADEARAAGLVAGVFRDAELS